MTENSAPDPARSRFIAIQVVRLSGVAMIVFALLIFAGRFDLPKLAGLLIGLFGMFDAFVAPILLARRWKSPPQ